MKLKREEIYLDLSKLSENEIKKIHFILRNKDENIHTATARDLINGIVTHCYWFLFFDGNAWNQNETPLSGRTELTYPEFIKLFEGGEKTTDANTFEKELFALVNSHCKRGLSKPDLIRKMEWVLGSCKIS